MKLINFLKESGITISLAEAKRMIIVGAVKVGGKPVSDMNADVEIGDIVACGTKLRKVKQ